MVTQLAKRLEVIGHALREWDPIGVCGPGRARGPAMDEYEIYVPEILAAVEANEGAPKIAGHLADIRSKRMCLGSGVPSEHEFQISTKLCLWRESGFNQEPQFQPGGMPSNNSFERTREG
jgi:hypothetical protein